MLHLNDVAPKSLPTWNGKTLQDRATGKFYTPYWMAESLAEALLGFAKRKSTIRVIDPFCGDGRLLCAWLEALNRTGQAWPDMELTAWDLDAEAVSAARANITEVLRRHGLKAIVKVKVGDTFKLLLKQQAHFDMVITNPPWEQVKPDSRELRGFSAEDRAKYTQRLREYATTLASTFPMSQSDSSVYGWGTNLSRCGLELAVKLLRTGGILGIVLPATIYGDQAATKLRRWLLDETRVLKINHFPAESRAFPKVDQPCITAVYSRSSGGRIAPIVVRHGSDREVISNERLRVDKATMKALDYRIPLELSMEETEVLLWLQRFPSVSSIDSQNGGDLWLGREIDETGYSSFTSSRGSTQFVKGRNVNRFRFEGSDLFLSAGKKKLPESVQHTRFAWRDVSRRSQARRVIASLLPKGVVTGNSLHVGYSLSGNTDLTKALLAVISSVPFEFQLRNRLGTGHISLGSVRPCRIPDLTSPRLIRRLSGIVDRLLDGDEQAEVQMEQVIAGAYELSPDAYILIAKSFLRPRPLLSTWIRKVVDRL